MTDKEQIIIDGVDVKKCDFFLPSNKYCGLYSTGCRFVPNCHFKQLARKTQEFEQLQEKYEALKLENEEGYEIVDELKQECEELKSESFTREELISIQEKDIDRYRKALEEIEKVLSHCVMTGAIVKILYIINKAKGCI